MTRTAFALLFGLALLAGCGTSTPQTAPLIAVRPSAAPSGADVLAAVQEAHRRFAGDDKGENATYIPALSQADPKLFGISVVTIDGKSYEAGDTARPFPIQSISKLFTLAEVLREQGDTAIVEKIGVDASGQEFTSISAVERIESHAANPLVDAGAIATVSLVAGANADERWKNILDALNRFAGRTLTLDDQVYRAQSAQSAKTLEIAKLLAANKRLYADPVTTVDVYMRQCSVDVTAHDLAVMGATIANGGTNPTTQVQAVAGTYVPKLLSVMSTAGLYDTTGSWMWKVGLPAKSADNGAIVAVAPGRFGVAVSSPPLDSAGNSVRAQKAIELIADKLGANVFRQ